MDNENIYDAAYSEAKVNDEIEVKNNFNEEPSKEKKKKRRNHISGCKDQPCRISVGVLFRTAVAGRTLGEGLWNRDDGRYAEGFSDGSSADDPLPAAPGRSGADDQQSGETGSDG